LTDSIALCYVWAVIVPALIAVTGVLAIEAARWWFRPSARRARRAAKLTRLARGPR